MLPSLKKLADISEPQQVPINDNSIFHLQFIHVSIGIKLFQFQLKHMNKQIENLIY